MSLSPMSMKMPSRLIGFRAFSRLQAFRYGVIRQISGPARTGAS